MIGNERDGMLSRKGIIVGLSAAVLSLFLFSASAAAGPNETYKQATEALYNLDFNTAENSFESLTREYPQVADYWNALASAEWLKIIYNQQKLDLESFSSSASFGTKDSRDALNPKDEAKLRQALSTAMAKANATLAKNPNDIRALYALGASNATLASFEGTAKRSYFTAYSKAKEARRLHQRVLQLDPTFHDARLAVGIYDYVVSVIPRFFRILFFIGGGDKQNGIKELETAAQKGANASTDARMLLVVVYSREKKFNQALRLIEELHSKYPRNFLFELSKASILGKMKRWDDVIRVYEEVLDKVRAKKDGYERLRQEGVYYRIGDSNIQQRQFDRALDAFSRVVSGSDSTADEKGGAHLWMGKIFDSKKDRSRALQQYDALLALDCDPGLKDEARRYKRRPFGA